MWNNIGKIYYLKKHQENNYLILRFLLQLSSSFLAVWQIA